MERGRGGIEGEKQDAFMTLQTIKINLLQGACGENWV